jgi:mono/diheme cytochrome c family protein
MGPDTCISERIDGMHDMTTALSRGIRRAATRCCALALGVAWAASVCAQPLASAGHSSLERGRVIFERYCVTCHGADGRAETLVAQELVPRPRSFVDPVDMARVTMERMYRATKGGKPGTSMAGWEEILTEPQIGDVIDYVRSLTPERDARSLSGDRLSVEIGARIYKRDCASCHGLTGRADTEIARVLSPRPRSFVDPIQMARVNDGRMYATIYSGKPGTAMGGWRDLISPQEIVDVMRYVRTLVPPLPAGMDAARLDLRVGEEIYGRHCAQCHGGDGTGRTRLGQQLSPRPRDFTEPAVLNEKTDQQLTQSISHGVDGTAMAPWNSVLNKEDIRRVIAFIRQQFGKAGPHASSGK